VWHDIGVRMGIRGIPPGFREAAEFKERFEERHMVYADSNREVAHPAIEGLLLADVPWPLRGFARRLLYYALMDDRLRDALGFSAHHLSGLEKLVMPWAARAAHSALWACHGLFTRFFLPPRPLHRALFRIAPLGCPAANSSSGPFSITHRRFLSIPSLYEHSGYKIEELGPLHPGKLAPPFSPALNIHNKEKKKKKKKQQNPDADDEAEEEEEEEELLLLCPLEACSNEPWPPSLLVHLPPPAAAA
jgi:hypothetical protein